MPDTTPAHPQSVPAADVSAIGLAIKDEAGYYRWANATYRAIHDLAQTPIGRTDAELLSAPVAARRSERERRVLGAGTSESFRETVGERGGLVAGEVLCLQGADGSSALALVCSAGAGPVREAFGWLRRRLTDPELTGPVGSYELDLVTGKLAWDGEMYEIYGHPKGSSIELATVISQREDAETTQQQIDDYTDAGGPYSVVHRIRRTDGTVRVLHSRGAVQRDEAGNPVRIIGTDQDITDQVAVTEETEQLFAFHQRVIDSIADAVCVIDTDGRVIFANQVALDLMAVVDSARIGFLLAELLASPDARRELYATLKDGQQRTITRTALRGARAPGRWLEGVCAPVWDQERVEGAVVTFRDVTVRARQEARLQWSLDAVNIANEERGALLDALVDAQEIERQTIAAEVHDDSVQVMSAVGLGIERLMPQISDSDTRARMADMLDAVRGATGRLRQLLFTLSPPALALHTVAAIESFAGRLPELEGVELDAANELDHEPVMATRLVLYRIAQEALTNVARHAQASRVEVRLCHAERGVLMTIRDDGVGIDTQAAAEPGHVGLASMRHRAGIAGGRCRIEPDPRGGTLVTVLLPDDSEERN